MGGQQQLKLFKIFNPNSLGALNRILGENNIVGFKDPNFIGIKYDFDNNKLKYIMQNIPFTLTQQLIITSQHFVDIIEKIGSRGYRVNYTLNMELPEEELSQLNEYIFRISRFPDETDKCKKEIFNEIIRLEDEYEVEFESVSFNTGGHRVVFRNNGILFANEDSFDIVGELLCY